jgi:ABC-type branched-subunit amino acid transport system substrate-binding protein
MRQTRRRTFLKGAGIASIAGLTGCIGGGGGGEGGGDTVTVGFIDSLTGPFAATGQRRLWASRAAVDRVNEEGGLNGREIELVTEDTETDPGVATTKVNKLINEDEVELLCGTFSSSVCLAVGPVASRNEVPYSAGYCATDRLTGEDCTSYAFRGTRSNPEIQWAGLGPYIANELGYTSGSIVYADYAWGQSELKFFKKYFEDQAGGEVLSEVGVPAGTTDFSQYLSTADTSGDFLAFIQAGGDSINLLQDVGSFGIHEQTDLVTVGAGVGEFLEEGGVDEAVADSLVGINYYPKVLSGALDNQANREFHDAYAEEADEPAPTRASSAGWEAIHVFQAIAEEIDYTGPDQSQEFVDAWRGLEMSQSIQFPQGDKRYRSDNQCILEQYIFDNDGYTETIVDTIPMSVAEDTPNECTLD